MKGLLSLLLHKVMVVIHAAVRLAKVSKPLLLVAGLACDVHGSHWMPSKSS